MRFSLLVYRQEKLTPNCHVLVKASTHNSITNEKELIAAIQESVQKWVRTTAEGRQTYEYAGGDSLNLGDMGDYAKEIVANSDGKIHWLKFDSLTAAEEWTYDTPLCDKIEGYDELPKIVDSVG